MAAGYRPVRLLPSAPAPPAGILPSFLCAPVRAHLASALAGAYRHLAGVGITHACDAMQCLAQSWQVLVREPPLYLVRLPTRRHQTALSHLVRELRDLGARLPVPVREASLAEAMAAARARRQQLREVVRRRAHLPPRVVWHALSQPWADDGTGGAQEAQAGGDAAVAQAARVGGGPAGVRVVLSGSLVSSPRLLETVCEAGGIVVGDDLCSGERGLGVSRVTSPPLPAHAATASAEGESGTGGTAPGDPWQALARQYLEMTPCPCRHPSLGERTQHLVGLVTDRGARAVILLREKFCEPHRWEDRALAAELRRRGIAVLELETEAGDVSGERDLTRLEAFLETVTAARSGEV